MPIQTEIALRLPNSPGALAGVSRLLSNERVNIVALALDAGGQLRLVVDNPVRAASVLRDQHHQITERPVVVARIPNGPGALAPILSLIAGADINLEYAYASTAEGQPAAAVVFGVDDAARAAAAAGL